MIPWNEKATLRKAENPVLEAIKACVAVRGYAEKPITPAFLDEVSAALSKATRSQCVAYHELVLVPASDGMVRVKVAHAIPAAFWELRALAIHAADGEYAGGGRDGATAKEWPDTPPVTNPCMSLGAFLRDFFR